VHLHKGTRLPSGEYVLLGDPAEADGDDDMERRRGRWLVATSIVVTGSLGLALVAVKQVTPVSHAEAVRRFHEERGEIGHRPANPPAPATKAPREKDRRPERDRPEEPRTARAADGPRPAGSDTAIPPAPESEAAPESERWPTMPLVVRPAEGVYAYRTEGHEGFVGIFDREFPPTSHRSIVHTGPTSWSDHTIFSEERESWSVFGFEERSRLVHSQRNRIVFAGYTEDKTVTFDPPLVSSRVPWQAGRAWSGEFSGDTYGSYEAETVGKELLQIGSERVMAWRDHLHVELHGDIEGVADVTRWLSPTHGVTLREEYRADAYIGPLHYVAEWSVTLRSLQPAT
jgi:hypothetical protein